MLTMFKPFGVLVRVQQDWRQRLLLPGCFFISLSSSGWDKTNMKWEMLTRFMINDCIWPACRQSVLLLQSNTIMGLTTLDYLILILFIFKFTWELRIRLIVFPPTTFHLSLAVNCMPSTCCLISWSHNTFPDLITNLITAYYCTVVLFLSTNWPTITHHSRANLFIFFF